MKEPSDMYSFELGGLTICAIIVTYGQRYHYLGETVKGVLGQIYPISRLIIVDNGCGYHIESALEYNCRVPLHVVILNGNQGSAIGFSEGMKEALKYPSDLIWILDDDNKPDRDALAKLVQAYKCIGMPENVALLARRVTLRGTSRNLPKFKRGGFLGFHLGDLVPWLARWQSVRDSGTKVVENTSSEEDPRWKICGLERLDVAPYGGLILPMKLLRSLGFPREDFISYADDTEWTLRITQTGGAICRCAESVVVDLEDSWWIRRNNVNPLVDKNTQEFRIYYGIRNQVYLEYCTADKKGLFALNALIRLTVIVANAMVFSVGVRQTFTRLLLLMTAIRDGLSGRLGICKRYEDWRMFHF